MARSLIISLLLALLAVPVLAQDVRYISDTQYVPVRSGAGNDYRIVHRGIPSGTKVTVSQLSDDGEWAQITAGDTSGWVRMQHLMSELPAVNRLEAAVVRAERLQEQNADLAAQLASLQQERDTLSSDVSETDSSLQAVTEELAQVKQVSGKALQLDADNRRLIEETENLRSEADMLAAENRRLQENLRNKAFMDGALAVLLGVVITLVVPRLWPKRRRNTGWA
ncbi:TIGR04211 family SH3 domain-containing protein [Kineobactrum salinum]|uniref:TIGR04211 family SH3 domain-containing protein n=1 Tax=Kineobactrum salinum TaxID=2708301 RepID=UPI001E5985EA|nr:TIGR04211 family SH3 domain-containing protein [Kineobactrum salinum]